MAHHNVYETGMSWDDADPEGYRSGVLDVSRALGIRDLSVKIFEVPPGQSLCPYHYEYEQEWLLILEGSIVLRTPAGEESLAKGDIRAFPTGPEGAHKTTNRGDQPARLMMFSSARVPAVAVYPDSDKIGVYLDDQAAEDELMVRRSDGKLGYFDGEA
jgi:uncharacterized cupin superfamily protein